MLRDEDEAGPVDLPTPARNLGLRMAQLANARRRGDVLVVTVVVVDSGWTLLLADKGCSQERLG